jgi:fatty-acyl-CoA synthase
MRFEFVSSAAVIGISDDKWGEVPLALLVVTLPEIDINQLRNELLQDLARYKVPKKFVIIAEMPRTASGKIKKPHLRQLVSEAALSEVLTDLR